MNDANKHISHTNFLAGSNINSKQAFDALMHGDIAIQKLAGLARWHYDIQDTSIPGLIPHSVDCNALHEQLKELNLSGVERHEPCVRREMEAREQLVLDLALSNDVYSAGPGPLAKLHSSAAGEAANSMGHPMEISYSKEPPEVDFGYFRPIRKLGADHYADKDQDGEEAPGVSSPLGVRLLLAEWELGTDPKDYTYHDPYGVVDLEAQPIPQYRRLPAATQQKEIPPRRPPLVVTAATQPPAVQTAEHAPATDQSQTVQRAPHSQQCEPGFDAFSQQPMTSTQTVPGPFGGRPGAKKAARKRIGGF